MFITFFKLYKWYQIPQQTKYDLCSKLTEVVQRTIHQGTLKDLGKLQEVQKESPKVFYKKNFLKISQNSQKNTCTRVSFLVKLQAETCNFIKKMTLVQVFCCEIYENFTNIFFCWKL